MYNSTRRAIFEFIVIFVVLLTVGCKQRVIFSHALNEYYDHEIEQIMVSVRHCLRDYLNDKHVAKKTALILDIDNTALATIDYNISVKGVSKKNFEQLVNTAIIPAIPATLNLYNFAKKQGIAIFFISNRRESWRSVTIENLINAGYSKWDGLYLRSNKNSNQFVRSYKTNIRKLLRSKGYYIVGNVGDKKSDLDDEYVRCQFKLPDPKYFVY